MALTGFQYSGIHKTMEWSVTSGKYFWSNGYSWGTVKISPIGKNLQVKLKVLSGNLELNSFKIKSYHTSSLIKLSEGAETVLVLKS